MATPAEVLLELENGKEYSEEEALVTLLSLSNSSKAISGDELLKRLRETTNDERIPRSS
jgi:hypothetical protein